jgi:hypothetical protein
VTEDTGKLFAAILVALLAGLIAGGGCTGPPTAQGQQVIDVLCKTDAKAQPIVVPVIIMAAPVVAGPAAPAIALAAAIDDALIHPAVVRACADYSSKPVAVVAAPPSGALVATPVVMAVPPVKP